MSVSNSRDIEGTQSGFNKFLFGTEEPKSIIKPYGVKVCKKKIYVCDTGLRGLVIIDLSDHSFDYFIPNGKGVLKLPINCDIDEKGYLYIADANRQQIVVFDENRAYVEAFRSNQLFKPTDVQVHGDQIYVANVMGHAIHVFDTANYKELAVLPGLDEGFPGYLFQATNISIRGNELFVSDFGDFSVKRYSMSGEYKGFIGGHGSGFGKFTRPKGIAIDPMSNLYVVDAAFENVQIFNEQGELLMHFGGSYEGRGAMWLPAGIEISSANLEFFEPMVDKSFTLKHLVYVTNQYGPAKLNIYGFVEPSGK
jgi:DNA-binding beta-propeller fold protein YncE